MFSLQVASLLTRKRLSTAVKVVLPLWAVLGVTTAQMTTSNAAQDSASGSAPFAGAVISEWKGPVQVQLPGSPAGHPVHGQVLPEGTTLDTRDGQLVLVLRSDESEILVQPHTKLTLQAPQPGNWDALQIILGKVRAYIRKRTGGGAPFQMGTPSAVIAVRGTRFDVEVSASGVSEIDVFEGLVEVGSSTLPGASVLVEPGMSTRVSAGTAPEAPVPTREIRPDVEAPDQLAKSEFARESAIQVDRGLNLEFGERSGIESGEVGGEVSGQNRESDRGKD